MNDRYDQDMLLDYIEGELSAEQRAAFEHRLAEDEPLRRLVEQLRGDRDALRSVSPETPPRDLLEDVTHRLERDMLLGDAPDADDATNDHADHTGALAKVAGTVTPAGAATPTRPAADARPAGRLHWAKALTYGSLAALVALCAALIFNTLNDTTLLEQARQFAQWRNGSPTTGDAEQSTGNGYRLAQRPTEDSDAPAEQRSRRENGSATDDAAPSTALADPDAESERQTGDADVLAESAEDPIELELDQDAVRSALAARLPDEVGMAVEASAPEAEAMAMRRDITASGMSGTGGMAPMRIEVATRDPEQTRQDLITWANTNQAILPPDAQGNVSAAEPAAPQAMVLRVRPEQVSDLVAHLNRQPTRQQAALMAPPTMTASGNGFSDRRQAGGRFERADKVEPADQPDTRTLAATARNRAGSNDAAATAETDADEQAGDQGGLRPMAMLAEETTARDAPANDPAEELADVAEFEQAPATEERAAAAVPDASALERVFATTLAEHGQADQRAQLQRSLDEALRQQTTEPPQASARAQNVADDVDWSDWLYGLQQPSIPAELRRVERNATPSAAADHEAENQPMLELSVVIHEDETALPNEPTDADMDAAPDE